MNRTILVFLTLFTSMTSFGQAVLLEENNKTVTNKSSDKVTESGSFEDVYALHAKRRVAGGASFLGPAGFIGANLDIHYLEDNSARVSLGGGPGYQSFGIAWRWMPIETAVHPVIGAGFTNWFGSLSGNQKNPSPPAFFADSVLSDGDRADGRFSHFFFVPTVGVEWTQLEGPGLGASLFAEINLLIHAGDYKMFPTANLGVSYAF